MADERRISARRKKTSARVPAPAASRRQAASQKHRGGSASAIALTLLVLLLLTAATAAFLFLVPFGPNAETFVNIPSGTGAFGIGALLERSGVVRSRYAFDLLRVLQREKLRAGEYRFDHPASILEIYRRLARGDVYTRTVIIPEGFNIFDIAQAVEAAGLMPATEFLVAERSETALVADLVPTPPQSLEGFLYPDTYRFSRHTTAHTMLLTMVRRFRREAATLGIPPGHELERTLILASIVEKEVGIGGERPLVASVFDNRLRAGMPLQTDPTVIYAALLDGRFRGTIYASDLHAPSPYNTYVHAGLPPGPICNPGAASLTAALHPAETDYLYFVSDAAGHTVFSATLAEHQQHVAMYRQAAREQSTPQN